MKRIQFSVLTNDMLFLRISSGSLASTYVHFKQAKVVLFLPSRNNSVTILPPTALTRHIYTRVKSDDFRRVLVCISMIKLVIIKTVIKRYVSH